MIAYAHAIRYVQSVFKAVILHFSTSLVSAFAAEVRLGHSEPCTIRMTTQCYIRHSRICLAQLLSVRVAIGARQPKQADQMDEIISQ